ncbi:hypothetical protein [Kitasatospora sp. Root107]|uniref:hypothetical protein n=1 Tax=Kitasatospora sp. Root107 TaxID=1736424 RepID=UPI001910D3E7|nr:hypothetical protein [Kitasatospora sp. Root107]
MVAQAQIDGVRVAGHAGRVRREIGGDWWILLVRRVSRGRSRVHRGRPVARDLGSPWQDTVASERTGWRTRAAWLYGESVFAVDYRICRRCRIGWVESPATDEPYRRCGLAAAGLAALRAERPGLIWHTLGGHFRESRPFWETVGSGIPGGYRQGPLCPHVDLG